MSVSVILLSAGKGSRMHEEVPKQYLMLGGKPIIIHTLERLDKINSINEIILVCDPAYKTQIELMLDEYNITTKIIFVNGGTTRQESVYNGLLKASNECVIIHEAARPFVRTTDFVDLIDDKSENITYGYDIPYTVLKGDGQVKEILNRSELFNVQLPQKFLKSRLLEAHEKAREEGNAYTEDASLLFNELGDVINIKRGKSYNLKITEPIDFLIGEVIYSSIITNRK